MKYTLEEIGKKLLSERSKNHKIEFIQSSAIGIAATCVEVLMIFIFTEYLKIKPVHSAALSYVVYSTIVYIISVKFIFHHRIYKNIFVEYLIFFVVGIIGMFLYTFFITIFINQLHLHYLLASIISGPLVYVWNFFSRKYILFSNDFIKFFKNYRLE